MKLRHKQSGEIFEIIGPGAPPFQKGTLILKRKQELREDILPCMYSDIPFNFEKIAEPGDSDYIGPFRCGGDVKPKRKYTKRKKEK